MKTLQPLVFDPELCQKEVGQLRSWLARNAALQERAHIQPFFRKRRHLAAFLASYSPHILHIDRLAFEYPLFGDFACDIVVGDAANHAYCFIELEEAGPASLFVKQGKKATRAWSPRFERGVSQVIDWFHKLDDLKRSDDFAARFGSRVIRYSGIVVVGRDQYLKQGERERLQWRTQNVVVASQLIPCVTLDGLVAHLQARLARFSPRQSV
jgi:hypothetical protein